MDQSNRYADLSLKEQDLISGGRHILVAYKMKPKAGHGYLQAAAHFANPPPAPTSRCPPPTSSPKAWTRWCT